MLKYRKIPVISPGLIQLRKGFWVAYQRRGLHRRGLISGIKKCFEKSHGSVDRNTFFKLKSQNKITFSPVQYYHRHHPEEAGLYPGWVGGLITGCILLFPVRWALGV